MIRGIDVYFYNIMYFCSMYINFIKRFVDIVRSFLSIVLVFPICFSVFLVLLIANNWKPFFLQNRPGKNEKLFKIIKFKTMNDSKDKQGNLKSDYERLSRVGKILRMTSIDELPQLVNVLIGNMSLIGPRPLLVSYLPLYNNTQKRRHEVRPGITGWAQVNGRNSIGWEKKFELDVWYVDNISFKTDMKIVWLTVKNIFFREGINQEGQATVESFKGGE